MQHSHPDAVPSEALRFAERSIRAADDVVDACASGRGGHPRRNRHAQARRLADELHSHLADHPRCNGLRVAGVGLDEVVSTETDGESQHELQFWGSVVPLEQAEQLYLRWALRTFGGDRRSLARALGVSERTLYRKLSPGPLAETE